VTAPGTASKVNITGDAGLSMVLLGLRLPTAAALRRGAVHVGRDAGTSTLSAYLASPEPR
jgi:hypothetical protein